MCVVDVGSVIGSSRNILFKLAHKRRNARNVIAPRHGCPRLV